MTLTIVRKIEQELAVKYLKANCGVRYWEDGTVNGVEDEDGSLIPLRVGDCWIPTIDLETGVINDWPKGTTASIHYKVCDAGIYTLIDDQNNEVITRDGYVPNMLCPEGDGYGDYVIMNIDENGKINNWQVDLSYFDEGNAGE